jgi:hypothetical protein
MVAEMALKRRENGLFGAMMFQMRLRLYAMNMSPTSAEARFFPFLVRM